MTRTFSIHNAGDMPLTIGDVALTGTHAGDFTITAEPTTGTSVPPNSNASVTVVFDPTAPGPRTATVQILSNDPESPFQAELTGIGTNAVIAVTNVAFGTIGEGTSDTRSISVSNTGAAPRGALHVSHAAINGGDGWFTFATNGAADCENDPTCALNLDVTAIPQSVGVRCSPPAGATGTQSATVTFASDSDAGGDAVADLSCTAGRANIDVQTAALAFNDVRVDAAPVAQNIIVGNNGNLPLVFTAAKVTSTFSGLYALSGCVIACNVPAGATRTVTVTFDPTAPTSPNANIDILITPANDPDTASVTVPVTGRGTAPQIDPPDEVALGDVDVGQTSAAQELTVTNTGTATLLITNAALTAGVGDYIVTNGTTGNQMTSVPPMTSVTWTLTCTPTTHGARPGTFRILSDSLMLNNAEVPLTCNGRRGVLAVSPTSYNFGVTPLGTFKEEPFVLRNTGNVAVTGITVTLTPSTATFYTIVGTVPSTLAPGATHSLTVRFEPLTSADGNPATFKFDGVWGASSTPVSATLSLNGDGLSIGFTLSETAIDFGNLRFDTTPTRTFCITNPNETTVTIQSPITITPGMGTMTNEFVVGTIRRQTTCGVGGSSVSLPQILTTGQVLEVTVRADPANRTGMMQATLTVTSNLSPNPTRTLTLAGNSTSGAITLDPGALVDFGAVDVQGPPLTRTLKIRNTGDAPLDLSAFARTTDPQFTFTLPPNTTVAIGASLDIVITYTPIVAAPMGSEEQIQLSHAIAGVLNGPASQTIVIRGRGIDRFIDVAPTPTFPDTYRNPGTDAPERTVRVQNLGEATLKLSAVMFTQTANAWELVNPSPIDIPKDGFHEFRIRFKPPMEAAFDATLRIVHDDDSKPPIQIMLRGNGLDRDVMFAPNVIDLGRVAVGATRSLTDALVVANLATRAFRVRRIAISEPEFEVDAAEDFELAPISERTFAVSFSPTEEGAFMATAQLFLDEDTEPQATIALRGQAVSVSVHGGGGCASSHGLGGGAVLLLLSLLPLRRRSIAVVLLAALVLLPRVSAADDIHVGAFHSVPATTGGGFQLESADIGKPGDWALSSVFSYATNPMVIEATAEGQVIEDERPITQRTMIQIGGAYAFLGRFEVGARMPFYSQSGRAPAEGSVLNVQPASGEALGDLSLHAKVRLLRSRPLMLGTALHVSVPTSTKDQFAGNDQPSLRALALVRLAPAPWLTLSFNGGPVLRKTAVYEGDVVFEQGSGFAWAAGISLRLSDRLYATGEVFGELIPVAERMQGSLSPIEALVGASYRMQRGLSIGVAAGRGVWDGLGAPDLRGTLMVSFTPGRAVQASVSRPVIPDPDLDGDGLSDRKDKCPKEAEDKNGVNDGDGCPDQDSDRDGIVDARDRCAREAEDRDGYRDDDGCPEVDNDDDGLADAQDRCPLQAETINGLEDNDGCPDTGIDTSTNIEVTSNQSPLKAAIAAFERGRELMKQQKHFAACAAFEQSQRLDPQFGTQFNLARCYVEIGKLATAWKMYRELGQTDKNAARKATSSNLAVQLLPRVPRIKMVLIGQPVGVNVFMNGNNVNALIGIETPVDLDTYTIVAGAPRHRNWRQVVEVKKDGELINVQIDLGPPSTP